MPRREFKTDDNPLLDNHLSMQEADAILYGASGANIQSDRVVAYPIEIFKLTADRTQPRRTVPLSIRGDWNGHADAVPGLLTRWHEAAEKELSQDIPLAQIFKGFAQEIDVDEKDQPIADKFMQVVKLANGIRRDGLINPIQINRTGDVGIINAGERRWLAHHLLVMYDIQPKKWRTIPAVDVDPDVWAQAQENGNRSPLNAIEMARQLALLIMDLYNGDNGVQFDAFDTLVSPGQSDRRYYAQVRDGNQYPVKRGFSDKILEATGLKSRHQISQYRNLLNLDDETWMHADEGNWTENYCRVNFLQKSSESEKQPDMLTTVNTNDEDMSTAVDITPDSSPSPATEIDPRIIEVGQIRAYYPDSDIPYMHVLEDLGSDVFLCHRVYENNQAQLPVSGHTLREVWQRILDGIPADSPLYQVEEEDRVEIPVKWDSIRQTPSIRVPAASEMDIRPGVPKTDKPKGVENPLGNKVPDYPHSGDNDNWDQSINPRATIYKPAPESDDGDNIPFIATNKNMQYLLSNFSNLAFQLSKTTHHDMRKQYDKLRLVNLWTPASIRERKQASGVEAVGAWIDEVDQALTQIVKAFKAEWEDFVKQVYPVDEEDGV